MNIEQLVSEAILDMAGREQTHYIGCWREEMHHECAVMAIERMRGELSDVLQFLDGIQIASYAPGLPGHSEIRNRVAMVLTIVGEVTN